MHDDMQAMRLLQMDKCIKDGQIPCRWVPDMGYGYGYPQFNFYPPLPYYVMETFHLLGLGYLDSVKAGFVLSVLVSTAGMYLLGSTLWGTTGGIISALLYAYAPYRAVDMYVRGAVGEFWALGFLPFILWSSKKVIEGNKRSMLWLALSLAGLFTSHNITTLIFVPIFIIWIIYLFLQKYGFPTLETVKKFKNIFIGTIWGFAMAAFFLLPAWFERKYVHVETLLQGYFNYLAHFVSIGQLLFSTYWGYGSSELGPYDDMAFSVGLIHWILPLLALFLFIFLKKKKETLLALFFIIVGWLALFMAHLKSVWIWDRITFLSYLQFPWRFLIIVSFAFSVASGSIALVFSKSKKFIFSALAGLLAIILLLNFNYFRPKTWIDITDTEKFSGELWQKQQTISIFDYLPIFAVLPPAERAPTEPIIMEGKAKVISQKKGTNWQEWNLEVETEKAGVRLPLFYFPGWKALVDVSETAIDYGNELGLITVYVPKGTHTILAKLKDTPVRRVGNLLSLGGLITIPLFLRKEKKK